VPKTLTKEDLIVFEEEIAKLYSQGKIPGPVHLSYGNEEVLIGIFKNINDKDWVFSTHRSHYHALLKGISQDWLRDEIVAGHSITINNPDYKFYASAIMGDISSIAVGKALALKLKRSDDQVWCFVGDMFAEMGAFEESVKYAERNGLPITFVVEDNGLSVVTPTQEAWGIVPSNKKVIRYEYSNTRYPHAGINKEYSGF
jgi:TPP-dependent pyruvate/acetoin dehydrogenase alpha subunit